MRTKRRATPMITKSADVAVVTHPLPKQADMSLVKMVPCTQITSNTVGSVSPMKKAKSDSATIRRSRRIAHCQPEVLDNNDQDVPIFVLSESEKDDHTHQQQLTQDIEVLPTQEPSERDGEEEEEEEDVPLDEHSPGQQTNGRNSNTKRPKNSEIRYRALYMDCRRKLEEANQSNSELIQKLAVAEGKLEVHEKYYETIPAVLDKVKDTMMVSALSKAMEEIAARRPPSDQQPKPKGRASTKKKTATVANLG